MAFDLAEDTLVSLDSLEEEGILITDLPEVQTLHTDEVPSVEKARAELICYASLLIRAPQIMLFRSEIEKVRLWSVFAPHAIHARRQKLSLGEPDAIDKEYPDCCYHCHHYFGQTREGRVRENCQSCRRADQVRQYLWSNTLYEFQHIAPLEVGISALFSQLLSKYYSPNSTEEQKQCQILLPIQ